MSNSTVLSRVEKAKRQHILAESLAKQAFAKLCATEPSALSIGHTEEGKPYCPQIPAALSISHSEGEVVVLVGPERARLGIDVQHVDERRSYHELAERFIDPGRAEWILKAETPLRFCYVWTRMEAMMKATGKPLLKLLATPELEGLPLASSCYRTEEGMFVLSVYGCEVTLPFARPLFA
ncbi:MAG: 4'-phosphopantetheinyl transferase superfamily protein [Sphaerochaetaceae bacterium]|nr:4'-phosphopantetheinyl transferase superfamily protein [Spirochaetales bacterium]MDY5499108.1 4'-phosphopantetheinyl transferase superfamily protein [Sphaerochaetaceae bacterium]